MDKELKSCTGVILKADLRGLGQFSKFLPKRVGWPCPEKDAYAGFQSFFHNAGGFQLEFVSISRVINHMTCYIIIIYQVLSLVEITAFRLESKSCKGRF